MFTQYRAGFVALAAALSLSIGGAAHASLIADGITYTLNETTLTTNTAQFDLHISGINGASDTEGGRSGVDAIAFTPPANFLNATAPSGFTTDTGGLNSGGCDGSGNFFCFAATYAPSSTPALATNSSLDFIFDLTLSTGNFSSYAPDFKIDWVGSKNHYDLVSQTLTPAPAPVPEPISVALLGTGLLGLGVVQRRRRVG